MSGSLLNRGIQAARICAMVRIMADGRWHRKVDLAARFNVCARTVLRDLEVASAAGFAIDQKIDDESGWPVGMYRLMDPMTAEVVTRWRRPMPAVAEIGGAQ